MRHGLLKDWVAVLYMDGSADQGWRALHLVLGDLSLITWMGGGYKTGGRGEF